MVWDHAACGRRQLDPADAACQSPASARAPAVRAVDHRFALTKPALMSAPSKKSFSSASCPIFAWRVLRSWPSDGGFVPPNMSAAHGRLRLKGSPVIASRSRHCLIPLARYLAVASVKPDNRLPHCLNFWSPPRCGFAGRPLCVSCMAVQRHLNS
jgi:hypothetical protein